LKTWPSIDYLQLTPKLTIFSQSNRTIWGDERRLVGRLDKQTRYACTML